jgi:hypothetical protein
LQRVSGKQNARQNDEKINYESTFGRRFRHCRDAFSSISALTG